jgi:hypothetical protein
MNFVANYRYNLNDALIHTTDGGISNQEQIPQGLSAGDGFDSDCRQTMVGFVQSSSSTMASHDVQCYYGNLVMPAHESMITDDLKQTMYSGDAGSQEQPQSTAEMAQDMRYAGDALAESAASSMVGDDFTDGIMDAMSADETLLQISDEPEDLTNLFLFEEFMMPSKTKRAVSNHASF